MQFFHVIFQSYFGKILFHDREDCLAYLHFVKRACETYQMAWLSFALMPNHIHLVLRGELEKLRHVRYNISSGYATYFRKKYPSLCGDPMPYEVADEAAGPDKRCRTPIFQPRNTTKWIQMNHDLKQVLRYVNRNPIEGGFEKVLGGELQ